MNEWAALGIVIAICMVLIYVIRSNEEERRDMLDRLMSRNLEEYKELTEPQVIHSEPVALTDEEEWKREIESMKSGA
ncbi:hypothetical protein L3i20_v212500 [Paenibacillus sp. L3-i20]|nr:hypothetical protein L3i20_v212500 [Paenibacillus sp. L3-i20]